MTWYFGIAAECGPKQEADESFIFQFESPNLNLQLKGGSVFLDREGNWWGNVVFEKIPPESEQPALKKVLELHAIKNCQFRYALAGVETDEFRYYSELKEDVGKFNFEGLILNIDVWKDFGEPHGFKEVENNFFVRQKPESG